MQALENGFPGIPSDVLAADLPLSSLGNVRRVRSCSERDLAGYRRALLVARSP